MSNFLEITSNNNWFKLHPEKIAGVEYETTSFYFPIMVKGTKEDVLRVTGVNRNLTTDEIIKGKDVLKIALKAGSENNEELEDEDIQKQITENNYYLKDILIDEIVKKDIRFSDFLKEELVIDSHTVRCCAIVGLFRAHFCLCTGASSTRRSQEASPGQASGQTCCQSTRGESVSSKSRSSPASMARSIGKLQDRRRNEPHQTRDVCLEVLQGKLGGGRLPCGSQTQQQPVSQLT